MKANFGGSKKESKVETGDFEAMMKSREKQLPRMEESVQELLDKWSGQSLALILMEEDENGIAQSSKVLITGVGRPESLVRLGKALYKASENAQELVIDMIKDEPKLMLKIMTDLASEIIEEVEEKKK